MASARTNTRAGDKNAKLKKSLPPISRRILEAAIRKWGSQRRAAKKLRLPNQGQVSRMLRGLMGETPAMKACRLRYEARALRVFLLEYEQQAAASNNTEVIRKLAGELSDTLEVLKNCL